MEYPRILGKLILRRILFLIVKSKYYFVTLGITLSTLQLVFLLAYFVISFSESSGDLFWKYLYGVEIVLLC